MSAMAPSRSTHRNLTADRLAKMELGSGQQQQHHSQNETSSSPARFQPASSGQPQQQQPQPQSSSSSSSASSSPFRFGAPDSRASYSERRLMNHSSSVRSTTTHNHPLGNGQKQQQQQHQHQSWGSGSHHTSSDGRSFNNAGLTALSRSNGSLAPSDKDANSSKPRSRTQTPGGNGTSGSSGSATVSSPASSNGSRSGRLGGGGLGSRADFGGSHGSLDALGASGAAERESFFALLRDLGAQSSSSGSQATPSRASPERDLGDRNDDDPDDPVHSKPVGCAPSRLAELLKPNFHSSNSFSLALAQQQQQQQSVMLRRSTPEPAASFGPAMQPVGNKSATLPADASQPVANSSPKPRSKFQRFWDRDKDRSNKDHHAHQHKSSTMAVQPPSAGAGAAVQQNSGSATSRSASEPSIFKRIRGGGGNKNSAATNGLSSSPEPDVMERDASDMEARLDERLKRKAFAHHDCQSMSVNLGYAARLRGLLSQRRNTTTGASAASMASSTASSSSSSSLLNASASSASLTASAPAASGKAHSKLKTQLTFPPPSIEQEEKTTPTPNNDETDQGDGKSNQLLHSCPFFRNEVGGEPEWSVGVTRSSSPNPIPASSSNSDRQHPPPAMLHKPIGTYGVSVVEFPLGKTHWRHGICPYQKQPSVLERGDQGAFYYGNHFYGQEHQNWFGMDETLGPLAISIRREKVGADAENGNSSSGTGSSSSSSSSSHNNSSKDQYIYRIIVRTSELATLRGTVLEEAIPSLKPPGPKGLSLREVLDMVSPEVHLPCLRLAIPGPTTEQQLLKLDQQGLSTHYKVGVLYCKAGQSTEEEMYNNEEGGPAFDEFLDLIGQRVRLRGFEKYKAGLDNKMDSTGVYSVYSQYQACEIMFHVSTLLPFTPNNRQQLLRKRHIGNDIVTVVFQEPGALPFTPKNIRSQFQHVFIIVRVLQPCSERTQYQVAVSRSKEVPIFGPPIPAGATFAKSKTFVDFLLSKIVNAEHAAHRSQKFATMATRTRQEYLKDLATNYVTNNSLDSGSKFPILTFSSRKKERLKPKFYPDCVQGGAICWQVSVDDFSGGVGCAIRQTDCLLGISADSLVLVEESTKECIWAVSCKAILGWTSSTSSIKLYYHQGECITVQGRDCEADEIPEIVARLHAVTTGCGTRELSLRRNAVGQLGFHVQPDGLVTEVEPHGPAWQASLRQGFRLVEICKVTVATLNHEQMVDLLKTSAIVTVTVLPPVDPNTPRRGCTLQSCSYVVAGSIDGEYDNVHTNGPEGGNSSTGTSSSRSGAVQQQSASVHSRRLRYERSVSPPRSSSSSGYGTGSSSRSFTVQGAAALAASAAAAAKDRLPSNPEGTLTSTSSGHSSDDPWYDFMPDGLDSELNGPIMSTTSPPPLPSRQGPSHHQRMRSENSIETFAPSPVNHSAQHQQRPHGSAADTSMKPSRSQDPVFPIDATTSPSKRPAASVYQTPPSKPRPLLQDSPSQQSVGRSMGNYEDIRRLHTSAAAPQETTPGKVRPLNPPDYHHAMQSRLVALKSPELTALPTGQPSRKSPSSIRSEDELSAASSSGNSLSPRSRRRHSNNNHKNNTSSSNPGTLTPSSGSSRNQSPRLLVEARLKSNANGNVSIVGGSSGVGGQGSNKRASTNLQEELLRLISPDSVDEELEPSVVLTHARPAAVQSPSDPMAGELPDSEEMDWSRLVHAAARAIQGAASSISSTQEEDEDEDVAPPHHNLLQHIERQEPDRQSPVGDSSDNQDSLTSWIDDVTEKLRLEAEAAVSAAAAANNPSGLMMPGALPTEQIVQLRMNQLEKHVGSLENRLKGEEDRRQALEAEIRRLRDANSRLQGESQTAAQQLKRFTDWFFQTIERP